MLRLNLLPISVVVHASEPRCFLIYVHTNKVNGKKYVGQNAALSNMRTAQRRRRFKEAVVKLSKTDVDLASIGYGC